jgi:probable phosphoglycerate mutase
VGVSVGNHRLVLLRHGETEWSRDRKHTSRTDLDLTDYGREQAELAAVTLEGLELDNPLVVSSPRKRALTTAALAGLTVDEVSPLLVEWDYGDYEGESTPQTRERVPNWSVWTHPILGGESIDDVGQRADRFLERFDRDVADGNGVVFAHGHFLAILIARWCGLPAVEGRRFALATATVSLLGQHREDRVIRALNHRVGDVLDPPFRT